MQGWMKGRSNPALHAIGTALLLTLALPGVFAAPAMAAQDTTKTAVAKPATPQTKTASAKPAITKVAVAQPTTKNPQLKTSKVAYTPRSYGISCVPYARAVTGMGIKGNAKDWWGNAAGTYARGRNPESGAVMSFQDTPGMRLGHVAVVTRVLDPRTVEIDHANWRGPGASKGGVFKSIPVRDVSANNDWSQVRVGLGHSGDFGNTVYPTNGFIYDRPDNGSMLASAQRVPGNFAAASATPARWRDAENIYRQVR